MPGACVDANSRSILFFIIKVFGYTGEGEPLKFKILQTSFVVEHSCVAETLRPTGLESRDEKVCSSNSLVAERTCFFTQVVYLSSNCQINVQDPFRLRAIFGFQSKSPKKSYPYEHLV